MLAGIAFAILSWLMNACGVMPAPVVLPSPTASVAPTPARATAIQPESTAAASPTSLVEITAVATMPVRVTAIRGNIFIRRGPDAAFDAISALMQGQSAPAMARDVLGGWVQIPVSGPAPGTGWISIRTEVTALSGDLRSLPEVEPTDWPIPAFLRNCTHHQMYVDPGGIILPPVEDFPDNEVRLNPGIYTVLDTDVDAYPEVLAPHLREGSSVDIQIDGAGDKKKCPVP